MHVQLLLEAKNDAHATNEGYLNDSIMSGTNQDLKFPGRAKVDLKLCEHILGPEARWMKNLNIVTGLKKTRNKNRPKQYTGDHDTVIRKMRTNLKKSWNPFELVKSPKRKTAAEVLLKK